ncbi:MAG: O-antigen ligase family protein [Planctomycetota bacterium]|nr:O-antigen ligase family protein [Planctomycetota bacterium]
MAKHGAGPHARKPTPPRDVPRAAPHGERVRRALQLGLTAVFVATPLIPSESPASGTGVMLILLWLLLLVAWSVATLVWPQAGLRWGWVDSIVMLFLVLYTVSGLVAVSRGDARAAINLLWLWLGFGVCFFLARQLLSQPRESRAICAVFVSLAVGLSAFSGYEYAYLMPLRRTQYASHPEQSLRDAGLDFRPGSPERKLYEDRLNSTEPSATFALTNSLAGFLAPWLVLTLAVGMSGWTGRNQRGRTVATVAGIAGLIGFCLLLTKSRSACLATGLGVLLIGSRLWRGGRRIDWRVTLIGLAALASLLAVAIAVGSFDWLVLSEAPKSVLYRLQYWRATLNMIADQPWFGCGPGNFQHYYPAYKLPEASETIADPHNFLLEIWATAGTPAMLAFAAIWLTLAWQLGRRCGVDGRDASVSDAPLTSSRAHSVTPSPVSSPSPPHAQAEARHGHSAVWIYAGGVLGLLLAYPCGAASGFLPDVELLVIVLPSAALAGVLLDRWVDGGQLLRWMLIVPLVVLYVNLLAAGGISFAGVAQTGWLLLAMVLNQLESGASGTATQGVGAREGEAPAEPRLRGSVALPSEAQLRGSVALPRAESLALPGAGSESFAISRPSLPTGRGQKVPAQAISGGGVLLAILLVVTYQQTMYGPVLRRPLQLAAGGADEAESRWDLAEAAYREAAAADPYSAEPWFRMASLDHQSALADASPARLPRFEQAIAELVKRNPHSQVVWKQIGDWRLALYRATADRVQLIGAIDAYTQCVRLYPNGNYVHAQLAWVYHVAGNREQANVEAQEALRLDARNPHRERALAQQRLVDPKKDELRDENAEQSMRRLRN